MMSIDGNGLFVFGLPDNQTTAMAIGQDTNAYLTFDTTDDAEKIIIGKNLEIGPMNVDADSGAVNFVNMDITTTTATSTAESLSVSLDGNAILTVYGEAMGETSGGLMNWRVGIGTTTPVAMLEVRGNTSTSGALLRISTSTTEAFYIDATGKIGIGTTTPDAKLEVAGGAICIDTADGTHCNSAGAAGDIYYQAAHSNWTDIAEAYPASEPLEPGDVVVLDTSSVAFSSPSFESQATELLPEPVPAIRVKKSTTAYDANLVGVVSTQPGVILGDAYGKSTDSLIALAGRVPVKISLENGPIEVGDFLTSASSTPGAAMKANSAGRVIGMALQAAATADPATSTKIMMLVNLHAQGNDLSVSADEDGQIVLVDTEQVKAGLTALGLEIGDDGFVSIAKLKVGELEIGSAEKRTGITLFDEETGEPYCLKIKAGAMISQPGACGEPVSPAIAPAGAEVGSSAPFSSPEPQGAELLPEPLPGTESLSPDPSPVSHSEGTPEEPQPESTSHSEGTPEEPQPLIDNPAPE